MDKSAQAIQAACKQAAETIPPAVERLKAVTDANVDGSYELIRASRKQSNPKMLAQKPPIGSKVKK